LVLARSVKTVRSTHDPLSSATAGSRTWLSNCCKLLAEEDGFKLFINCCNASEAKDVPVMNFAGML
jgi:hypothetical protein